MRARISLLRNLPVALLTLAGAAPAWADMRFIETEDVRVTYFEPTGEYLVPYATQCFVNALAAQHTRLDYKPDEKLDDPAAGLLRPRQCDGDERAEEPGLHGNRASDAGVRDVQPGRTDVHDCEPRAGSPGRPSIARVRRTCGRRHWLGGKVTPTADHPESLLYNYLTTPRNTAPRWYHEGSAVFMETWLGGGLGRAQGGYDEMMFRAMVRDDAQFYDPLGLVSKGTEVDFQVGANAYLYGTRFMSYLAIEYGPEKLLDWWRRDDGSPRSYSDDFRRVFGLPLDQAWQDWIAWEHEFQRKNLASVREHPITPHRDLADIGLGAISRAICQRRRRDAVRSRALSGPRAAPRVHLAARTVASPSSRRCTVRCRIALLRWPSIQSGQTLFYTTDNLDYRNLMALRPENGQVEDAAQGRSASATSPSTAPTGRSGDCAPTTAS